MTNYEIAWMLAGILAFGSGCMTTGYHAQDSEAPVAGFMLLLVAFMIGLGFLMRAAP